MFIIFLLMPFVAYFAWIFSWSKLIYKYCTKHELYRFARINLWITRKLYLSWQHSHIWKMGCSFRSTLWSTMILIEAIPFWMTDWIIIIMFQRYFSHANCSTINKLIFVWLTLLTCTHNGYFKQRAQFSRYGITNPTLRTDWYAHLLISFFVIRSNLKHKNHFIFAIYFFAFP